MGVLLRVCACRSFKSEGGITASRFGHYIRKSDRCLVQRFRCRRCGRTFSEATSDLCFKQHKRHYNRAVGLVLVSGVSLRRAAFILNLNRKTVVRKFLFLGKLAQRNLEEMNLKSEPCSMIEFDDLETSEHTKLKPLSVTLAVEYKTRRILGFCVSQMPANGRHAALSRSKYGRRTDLRSVGRDELFKLITPLIRKDALIKSDENPHYPSDVKRFFPHATHKTFKGRKPRSSGLGELKRGGFDPLYTLNHTCAMLRANINRLFRKTWCTTKKSDRLALHIALYAVFHNQYIIKN
jgi:transposase-like protein